MSETAVAPLEWFDDVALITLRRPEKHNALNGQMVADLSSHLSRLSGDERLRVLVLTGAGDRAFCAGADIHEMVTRTDSEAAELLKATRHLFRTLAEFPRPTIAAVNGHAHGGGAELACACDLRIASAAATFRFPGVVYGMAVGTWHLPNLVGMSRAKELLFTAATVEAAPALSMGLVNRLVDSDHLLPTALGIARQIALHPREAVAAVKSLVDRNFGASAKQRFYRELYSNRDRNVTQDRRQRFASFLERPTEKKDQT